jgi:hypothetical protein
LNYANISDSNYLTPKNSNNPYVDKNFYSKNFSTKYIYNSPVGKHCNSGRNECSLEFSQMGPFTYNGYTDCYIYDGFSGPDDKQETKGNGFNKIFMDINAKLKCIVNGVTYNEVQRVNIIGYNSRLPLVTDFPVGTVLSKGSTTIPNSKHVYTIMLNDCTNVWSYKENVALDCECDKI